MTVLSFASICGSGFHISISYPIIYAHRFESLALKLPQGKGSTAEFGIEFGPF